jgi:hypothetical protein
MSQANVDAVRAVWPREVDVVEMVRNPEVFSQFAADVDRDIEVVFMTETPVVAKLTFHGIAGLVEGWRDCSTSNDTAPLKPWGCGSRPAEVPQARLKRRAPGRRGTRQRSGGG